MEWLKLGCLVDFYGYVWYSPIFLTGAFVAYFSFSCLVCIIIAIVVLVINAVFDHESRRL